MDPAVVADVIIVGGGLAGLSTAYDLCKRKQDSEAFSICLLEGRGRFGGRLRTETLECGKTVDLGGMWLGPQQHNACNLAKELGVELYQQYVDGKNIHFDGKSKTTYVGTIPSVSIFSLLDTHVILGRLEKHAKEITVGSAHSHPRAAEWDAVTLAAYGKKKCWTNQAQSLLGVACRVVFGCECDQLSLLYFLHYAASAGGVMALLDSEDGAQDRRMKGGSKSLYNGLAEALKKFNSVTVATHMECTVTKVEYGDTQSDGKCLTKVVCQDGRTFLAKRIVICTPPSAMKHMTFSPPLPALKQSMLLRSHATCYIKTIVVYTEAFWRTAGYSGSAVFEHSNVDRPLTAVFDYCDGGGANPALACFIAGNCAMGFVDLSPTDQRDAILNQLVGLFGPQAGTWRFCCTNIQFFEVCAYIYMYLCRGQCKYSAFSDP